MRLLPLGLLALSAPAMATDYRDCKELHVVPLAVMAPETKANGAPWDDGSPADPQLSAVPADRHDIPAAVVGPKLQDTAQPAWNSLFTDETRTGAWLPVRAGDTLALALIDRDAFADDVMAKFDVEVPKDLATNGVAFVSVKSADQRTTLALRIAATDGKRTCAGVDAPGTLTYVLPAHGFAALPDAALFEQVKQHNRCNVNATAPGCALQNYRAVYVDLNQDGTMDTLVKGGPFAGSKAFVIGLALGFDRAQRQTPSVQDCDDAGLLKPGQFTCTSGDKTVVIDLKKGSAGIREATAGEVEKGKAGMSASRATEAQSNLKALFVAQKAYFAEHDRYSTNATAIGFAPERGNRYAYMLAARGEVQARNSASLLPMSVINIVGPDLQKHPEVTLPAGLKEAGCPLTFGTNADGEPVGLGVSGAGNEQNFVAYALGNVDDDADFDCWSIASIDRKSASGEVIPAGTPYHERSDYDEAKVAAPGPR